MWPGHILKSDIFSPTSAVTANILLQPYLTNMF